MVSIIAFSSAVGPVPIDVIIKETHNSSLEITEIPIEDGSRITDHAFKLPKKLSLDTASGNAAATYNALVAFQVSRVPFTVVSGFFIYTNMLIKDLSADRDKDFTTVLRCRAELQEILIVSTAYAADTSGATDSTSNSKSTSTTAKNAGDPATADRVAGTTDRGDTGTTTTSTDTDSTLHRIFN